MHQILQQMKLPGDKTWLPLLVLALSLAAGSLELAREVVASVLSERIDKGWITREVA